MTGAVLAAGGCEAVCTLKVFLHFQDRLSLLLVNLILLLGGWGLLEPLLEGCKEEGTNLPLVLLMCRSGAVLVLRGTVRANIHLTSPSDRIPSEVSICSLSLVDVDYSQELLPFDVQPVESSASVCHCAPLML